MRSRIFATAVLVFCLIPIAAEGQTSVDQSTDRANSTGVELPVASPEAVGMSSEKLSEVAPALQKVVDDGKVAGAIVAVARHGKVVLMESVGYSNIEEKEPMSTNAILRFYSMTKPITSVAIMMLVEEGKIGLDDPAAKHLPEFDGLKVYVSGTGEDAELAEQVRPMTVRDLLRHTSGLTYGFFGQTPVDRQYVAAQILWPQDTLEQTAAKLAKLPLLYQPGTRFNYSVSTDILGLIVQRVSGQSLDDFFAEQFFEPLQMRDTAFYAPPAKADRLAINYSPGSGDQALQVIDSAPNSAFLKPPTLLSGGGGLVSTARDYLRFCVMLANRGELNGVRLLQPETVDRMTLNQLPKSAYPIAIGEPRPGIGFGLGFSVVVEQTPQSENARIGEYGWGGAASTHFWISPRDDLAVVVLTQLMPFTSLLEDTVRPLVYDAIEN
jgi:CubicO group peptidase (beta-lactamase class C family)